MPIRELLQAALGANVIIEPDATNLARHCADFAQAAPATLEIVGIAYPRDTAQVASILRLCHTHGVSVVPQGGMTGIAGGAVPCSGCLILSLERMRDIEEIDLDSNTLTVQAGVTLEAAQQAADSVGLYFPVDWGARGSAHIGGGVSTNAGGNRVLRFGMMREAILGLEVVLADGTVLSSLNKMIKNNAGYDLKQLFIGSEGTLGVVTRVVLKLQPQLTSACTALLALQSYEQVLALLRSAKTGFGGALSAFEVMWPDFYRLGTTALGRTPPLATTHGMYVLMETMGMDQSADSQRFEQVIGECLESGVILDAAVAQSLEDARKFWAIRECTGEFSKVFAPQVNFDVSAPTGTIAALKEALEQTLKSRWPAMDLVFFGHVADSNVHFAARLDDLAAHQHDIEEAAYEIVGRHGGSISAEHGIGSLKREFLHYSRSATEIAVMKLLKSALDPKGILNPGKVV